LSKSEKNTKISIGMPVYNGEPFVRKALDSILAQTFTDFELIISDNASTDSTPNICEEYLKKDHRIHYIRQKKNMGANWNFDFVLQKANTEYFVWAAADNILLPDFLKRNIDVLESQKKTVGCISKIGIDKNYVNPFKTEKKILKIFGLTFRPYNTSPIVGTYEERIRTYLKSFPWQMYYAVYRTDKLRKSFVDEFFAGNDAALVLNILKYGEIQVVNQVLLQSFPSGMSSGGMIQLTRLLGKNFLARIFPCYPLTVWCLKNLGLKIFSKNLDHFIRLNFDGIFLNFVDILQKTKRKFFLKRSNNKSLFIKDRFE